MSYPCIDDKCCPTCPGPDNAAHWPLHVQRFQLWVNQEAFPSYLSQLSADQRLQPPTPVDISEHMMQRNDYLRQLTDTEDRTQQWKNLAMRATETKTLTSENPDWGKFPSYVGHALPCQRCEEGIWCPKPDSLAKHLETCTGPKMGTCELCDSEVRLKALAAYLAGSDFGPTISLMVCPVCLKHLKTKPVPIEPWWAFWESDGWPGIAKAVGLIVAFMVLIAFVAIIPFGAIFAAIGSSALLTGAMIILCALLVTGLGIWFIGDC